MDSDTVFKALADPTRRRLLDRLFDHNGQSITQLEADMPMGRFGIAKHLRILEEANLLATRRQGREKLHFLNPVPIRQIHDRWISRYAEAPISALISLAEDLESHDHGTDVTAPTAGPDTPHETEA
ncbi:metalloregulator ArsR/SmtB family transcription factor [Brevibacterium sp. RIT 803]|uniref:ArsR/SmtB family transcription factor n=1 Tax=Brevibacterium sp. RIT 803 TaxID=2810210 RepID=UPI00338FA6B3